MTDPTEIREALEWLEAVAGWAPPEGYEDAYPRALATALALARLGAQEREVVGWEWEWHRASMSGLYWNIESSEENARLFAITDSHATGRIRPIYAGPPETVVVDNG